MELHLYKERKRKIFHVLETQKGRVDESRYEYIAEMPSNFGVGTYNILELSKKIDEQIESSKKKIEMLEAVKENIEMS